jgi:hypothetical protein
MLKLDLVGRTPPSRGEGNGLRLDCARSWVGGKLMALKAAFPLPLIKHNPRSRLPTLGWRPTTPPQRQ